MEGREERRRREEDKEEHGMYSKQEPTSLESGWEKSKSCPEQDRDDFG